MSENGKSTILRAFRLLLQPIVRTLVRSGVTWKEAAEVCKTTFVEVATSEFGLHGRPTNMSRVYYGLSGSDANETNIKLVWYYNNVLGRPEKKKIISRVNSKLRQI